MPIKINELVFQIKLNDREQSKEDATKHIMDPIPMENHIRLIQKDLLELLEDQKTR